MSIGNLKCTNTILYCQHFETTVRFYHEVLKLVVNHESEWFVEFQLASNTHLSIANAENASIKSANGDGITLSWQVDDLEKTHHRLEQLGINTSRIKHVWGSRAFYLFDPEGHRLEFWSQK